MFEVTVNQEKQRYHSKPTMDVDITGSSGSIPKPLTYDYMPEGYPSKSIGSVTLMEEQEVTFSSDGFGAFTAVSPVALDAKLGDKLTVVWDGVSYDVIAKELEENVGFGNLAILDPSTGSTSEPFIYTNSGSLWFTTDTATSHTIKVMRQQETIAPMSTDFIPKNLNVVFRGELGHAPTSCNVTYNELRDWVERDIPVFAVFITANAKFNITSISLLTDSLAFIYYLNGSTSRSFVYKSDGTFVIQPNES